MSGILEERLRRMKQRLAVRAWEYRQRNLAKGVWYRLRRVLVDAERAYALTEDDAAELLARGYSPSPVGRELSPEKRIFVVPQAEVDTLPKARRIEVRLGPDLLGARCVALVRFQRSMPA